MSLRRTYERIFTRWAVHGPDYNLLVRRNDGRVHGIVRLGFHASWALFAAALTAVLGAASPSLAVRHPLLTATLGVTPLLLVKIGDVIAGLYRADPLDWLCDVGAWGSAGALLVAQLMLHASITPIVWLGLAIVYLLTYPWATP